MTEFITRNHGNKEYEIIIKTDSKEHYEATEVFARRLIDHAKPQTNADRIRAMSDEELAEQIINGISSDPCDCCEHNHGASGKPRATGAENVKSTALCERCKWEVDMCCLQGRSCESCPMFLASSNECKCDAAVWGELCPYFGEVDALIGDTDGTKA